MAIPLLYRQFAVTVTTTFKSSLVLIERTADHDDGGAFQVVSSAYRHTSDNMSSARRILPSLLYAVKGKSEDSEEEEEG